MSETETFRWAVLGTGPVARKFVLGLRAAPGHVCVAAASRSADNAAKFAKRFKTAADTYETAVARPDVDAVYIATPPSLHEPHALMAIAAGKPVLIEKPFALDAAAAARIAQAARTAGVFCMEAMWTRFLPLMDQIQTRLDGGDLGDLRSFHGVFCNADIPDAGASLYDPARGGGALMHRGYYAVSLALHFLGPVRDVQASLRRGETGVDEDVALILTHDSGAISTLNASLRSGGDNRASLRGTKGRLEITAPIFRPFEARLYRTTARKAGTGTAPGRAEGLKEGGLLQGLNQRLQPLKARLKPGGTRLSARFAGNGYGHEALAVAAALRAGLTEEPRMPLDDSLAIMAILDRAKS